MDGARRRQAPPRLDIGDAELGRMRKNDSDDAATLEGNTLVGDRHDVDFTSMEQRYTEALQDAGDNQTRKERDDLAKPEGVHHSKTSGPAQAAAKLAAMGEGPIVGTPDTDESDFDWDQTDSSDEEEIAATKRAKEEVEIDKHRHNVKRAKRLRKVYIACIRLSRPVRTLLFALVGGGILIIPAVVVWTAFSDNRASPVVRDNVKVWSLWLTIVWTSACGTSIFVDAIPFIVSKISVLLTGLYPAAVKSKVTLFDGAKFWLKCILISIWAWVSGSVLSDHVFTATWLHYFRWVIHAVQSIFASSIVIYVEKLIVQYVKASFHQNALKDRIEENARALWALDKLAASKKSRRHPRDRLRAFAHSRGPSQANTPVPSRPASRAGSPEVDTHDKGRLQGHAGRSDDTIVNVPLTPRGDKPTYGYDERPHNLRQRSGKGDKEGLTNGLGTGTNSPDPLKGRRSAGYFRKRSNSKTIAVQLAEALSQATLKDRSRNTLATQHSAKKMARRLFEGLGSTRDYLIPEDFVPYFATRADAEVAFSLFDKDGNGDITKKEMRSAVQRIYRERKALKASLSDMGSAVRKLDGVMLAVCLVIILFIWFLIFNRQATVSSLTSISTIVAALSFIFSNAASTLFNSMIFIFSTQPYSIGDLVFIDADPLIVKEFGLMSTVFERVDGQYMIAPNSVLSSSKHILNVRRSGSMWETTNIQVGIETPLEAMSDLRARMRQFVNDNSREWGGGLDMNIDNMSNQNAITIIVALQHKGNWQDWGGRWNRRTKLMRHMKTVLDDLGITYKLPLQPVQLQVRGGASPFSGPKASNDTSNGNDNGFKVSLDSRFLSPDVLGNGARIGSSNYQPAENSIRRTDASM